MRLLITGALGFIGTNLLNVFPKTSTLSLLDAETYAGNQRNPALLGIPATRYKLFKGLIQDGALVTHILKEYQPDAIIHLAAESHVDRSISEPKQFLESNVTGTQVLLEAFLNYWIKRKKNPNLRFLHVSTDAVYGSLGPKEASFTEESPYRPNNPYSASKASSDHFVRAYRETFGLPTLITHCSNNYGPFQHPEKLIPRMLLKALAKEKQPIHGTGVNIRDWIHVKDHCLGLKLVLRKGLPGETYNFGGNCELTNLALVKMLDEILDELSPLPNGASYKSLIEFVPDRLGNDARYSLSSAKAQEALNWNQSAKDFRAGLLDTIQWYINQSEWIQEMQEKGKL